MNTLFFELLQVALGSRKELHGIPTVSEWNEILLQAERQTLIGIAFCGVERLPQEQRPPKELIYKLFSHSAWVERQNEKKNHICTEIQKWFWKNGFPSCILKGQGLAQYYDQPLRRQSGDIDIWVEGGWKKVLKFVYSFGVKRKAVYHHVDFGRIDGVNIEVHFTPSWMYNPFKNYYLQKWFKSKEEQQFTHKPKIQTNKHKTDSNNTSTRVKLEHSKNHSIQLVCPTDDFNTVYLLLHMYRHIFDDGLGLRQLLDYYVLLTSQSLTEGDKEEILRILGKLGMMRFAKAVIWVLSEVFGLTNESMIVSPDEKYGHFLLDEVMQSGNFGQFDERMEFNSREGRWHKFFRRQKRNMRFLRFYPDEVLWRPYFILYNLFWRKKAEWLLS